MTKNIQKEIHTIHNTWKHITLLLLKSAALCTYYVPTKWYNMFFDLFLQQPSHRHALLAHPVIAAERRQHYNMARTMAGLSLNFIIVVTPWTLKEVVVSCTGTKVRE